MVSIVSIVLLVIISAISIEGQSWSNCGSASDTVRLTNFQLEPFPIRIPSIAQFILEVDLKADLANPIRAIFKLSTQFLFFWVDVPCQNDVGSCTYQDWCVFCKTCQCPFVAGRQTMVIPLNITDAVPAGNYRVQIEFISATEQYGCVYIDGIQVV